MSFALLINFLMLMAKKTTLTYHSSTTTRAISAEHDPEQSAAGCMVERYYDAVILWRGLLRDRYEKAGQAFYIKAEQCRYLASTDNMANLRHLLEGMRPLTQITDLYHKDRTIPTSTSLMGVLD